MKYRLLIIVLIAVFAARCERNDICEEGVDASLLKLGFFDTSQPDSTKSVSSLYVWAAMKDSLYVDAETDSIALPLDPGANHVRFFISDSLHVDTLDVFYDKSPYFVSEACGFIHEYKIQNQTQVTAHWIQAMQITDSTITHENIHIRLYH